MKLRILNPSGKEEFIKTLATLRLGGDPASVISILTDKSLSVESSIEIPSVPSFGGRQQFGEFLVEHISGDEYDRMSIDERKGLFDWLSLLFFDQLCPTVDGKRKIGDDYNYLMGESFRNYYRHLVFEPFSLVQRHGILARVLLSNPLNVRGDLAEQIHSRRELVTNRAVMELLHRFYFDAENGRPKLGATNRRKAGNVRRFVAVLEQFKLTFDLQSLASDQLVTLLPEEFIAWTA